MERFALDHFADSSLLHSLRALVARDRETTAELVAHLAEVDRRGLYADAGYPSMRAYCLWELGLSEDETRKRMQAARSARRHPVLLEALADGRLHLTAVNLLATHLTEKNVDELVEAASHKTRAEIEVVLARRFPRPDAPDGVVELTEGALEHTPDGLRPRSPERYLLQCAIGGSTRELLQRARELMSHRNPDGNFEAVLQEALEALIPELEKQKFAVSGATSSERRVPANVKKAVWERDGGACTFVGRDGRRCGCRWQVEFDHMEPVACGGTAAVDNVRLLCRVHNQREAERRFGTGFMEEKRRARKSVRESSRVPLRPTGGTCSGAPSEVPAMTSAA